MPVEKLRPSFTFTEDRLEELKAVLPEAFADGKINWDVLREALGEYLEGEEQEHFGLTWPGKRDARRLAALKSKGTLVPKVGEGINENTTQNIFIEGENLEVLKLLQKSYASRIKLIYIDPPYNTGNDFVYPDDYKEPLETYLQRTGQLDESGQILSSNTRASGRFHSNWLNMMYPRLLLARTLLKPNGAIFVSIDKNEEANLRLLMNEVFGEENFIASICVISNLKGRSDDNYIATAHESLLFYHKGDFETYGLPLPQKYLDDYPEVDEKGNRYRLLGLRKRGAGAKREDRPNMYFPFFIAPSSGRVSLVKNDKYTIEVYPKLSDGSDGRWRWGFDTVKQRIDELKSRKVSGTDRWDIFQIDFAKKDGKLRRIKPKSIWMDKSFSNEAGTLEYKRLMNDNTFNNPKPSALIKQCIIQSTFDNDIVLDFFAGSGTTAQAVLEQNRTDGGRRRFILIQIPEKVEEGKYNTISEICGERIRRVIGKMEAEFNGMLNLQPDEDLGFRYYKLDQSHYKEWHPYTGENTKKLETLFDQFETPLMDNWEYESLLTEIQLLQGFPLDSRVDTLNNIKSNVVKKIISDGIAHLLFVCFDDEIRTGTIETLNLRSQDIFVCLDSALRDEDKVRLSDKCNLKVI